MRRGKPEVRPIVPDLRYNSVALATFVQHMMIEGKRSLAFRLMYDTLEMIEAKTGKPGIETFDTAIKNVGPAMEVRPRRVGGATYQVPMEVPSSRRMTLAMRWIIDASKKRAGKSFSEKLSGELLEAYNNQGTSVRKREETHKMAEANRAFSHYRL